MDTSPSDVTAANTAPAMIPGLISGNVTRRNVCAGLAPRLLDAASRRGSKLAMLAFTQRTTYGRQMTACPMAMPASEPARPSELNTYKSAMPSTICGTIRGDSRKLCRSDAAFDFVECSA